MRGSKETIEKCKFFFEFKKDDKFNHRHTIEYFEDYNLSLTQKSDKKGFFTTVSL